MKAMKEIKDTLQAWAILKFNLAIQNMNEEILYTVKDPKKHLAHMTKIKKIFRQRQYNPQKN